MNAGTNSLGMNIRKSVERYIKIRYIRSPYIPYKLPQPSYYILSTKLLDRKKQKINEQKSNLVRFISGNVTNKMIF